MSPSVANFGRGLRSREKLGRRVDGSNCRFGCWRLDSRMSNYRELRGGGSAACTALPFNRFSRFRLLTGFDLGRNETHLVHTSSVDFVNYRGYVGEGEIFITLDERNLFSARLEDVFKTALQFIHRDIVLVDLDGVVLEHLDDDCALIRLRLFLRLLRRLRNQRVETLGRERCDDHEDDQQHEQHVDQRRYVNVCLRTTVPAANCHCHSGLSYLVPADAGDSSAPCLRSSVSSPS